MNQMLMFRFISPEWVEWLAGESTLQQGLLTELANQATGQRLVLVVPGEAVFLTQATLPGRNRTAWLKALPYALEDSLAGDVEDLHFAVGEVRAGAPVPVAVVSHEKMKTWLDACTGAGLAPAAVVPDTLLLPFEEGTWSLLLENNRGVVRNGSSAGFATEREDLPLVLGLALAEAGEHAPKRLRVWGDKVPELAYPSLEIHQQTAESLPLQVFAANYDSAFTLNLLQGPYSRKAHLGKWLKPWRPAAILAGIWLGLHLVLQVNEYWQLTGQQVSLRADMEQIYKDAAPGARKIVNPRAQLENRLRELRQGNANTEAVFLDLLYRGAQPLIAFQGVTLRGLRYKEAQLDLDLESSSLEILDQLKQRFSEQADIHTEMRTTKREGKVESQVSVKRTPP